MELGEKHRMNLNRKDQESELEENSPGKIKIIECIRTVSITFQNRMSLCSTYHLCEFIQLEFFINDQGIEYRIKKKK